MKKKVIIDCDPGYDDAIALMLAFGSGELEVKAVTTIAGNQTQEKVHRNALRLLSSMGVSAIVARGANRPLTRELSTAGSVHGESGLDGVELEETTIKPSGRHAVEVIADIVRSSREKVTLVPIGPLTNIALFVSMYPELKASVESIILMGGACRGGNVTPVAEFNIKTDPEAAEIVFSSGIPIVMCGLDVTRKALIYADDIRRIGDMGNRSAKIACQILKKYLEFYYVKTSIDGAPIHDACAVAYAIAPEIFTSLECHVDVETKGIYTDGQTVADMEGRLGKQPNARVVLDLDRERLVDMIISAVGRLE